MFEEREKHYITIWMLGESGGDEVVINDTAEIEDVGWFNGAHSPSWLR